MKRERLFFLFFLFLILTALASVCAAKTIYVPDDYAKIQRAVNHASAGDTIIVRDGIYYESITVSKQLTIKSENGSDNCIVNGTGSNVFTLKADGIRIEGFTITGGRCGIYILSNNNKIINNNIISNNYDGILLWHSIGNSISNNNISNNYDGIDLGYSDNNSISNNIISSNIRGISFFLHSDNNSISCNNFSNNSYGIYIHHSNNNSIVENNFSNNWHGICIHYSNNIIYLNNFINNTYNADSYGIRINNIWNSTEPIKYTYKGSNFTNYMGNYWDDYNGSDANRDGLGDTAYMIPSLYDKDYHPLMEKFENYIVAEKEGREVPGFEAFFAIAGLSAVAYLLIRRK